MTDSTSVQITPADWTPTDFVREWSSHTGYRGMTRPLPERWRVRVRALALLGLPFDDLADAIAQAQARYAGKKNRFLKSAGESRFNYFILVAMGKLSEAWDEDDSALPIVLVDRDKAIRAREANDPDWPAWSAMGPLVRKDTASVKNDIHDIACPGLVGAEPEKYTAVTIDQAHPDGICQTCRPDLLAIAQAVV